MAKKSDEVEAQVRDWRQAPDVVALKHRQHELTAKLQRVEADVLVTHARLDGYPDRLHQLQLAVLVRRAPASDVELMKAAIDTEQAKADGLEAEAMVLKEELAVMPDALREVSEKAQHQAVATLQAAYKADAEALLQAYEAVAEISARMDARYMLAGKQFPLSVVYGQPQEYAKTIKSHGGLELLHDLDAVRLRRGLALWDPQLYAARFKQIRDGLRSYLGLPLDRGVISAEGEIALAEHKANGAAEHAARAEHQRQADAYNQELEAERARSLRAHQQSTARALTDAQRR